MRTGKPDHLASFDYRGTHRYFLTFCTHKRARHFTTADRVALVLAQFQRAAEQEPFAFLAWCFMPDHVHLLVQGQTEAADVRPFIRLAKQLSGFHFKQRFGAALWQRYGYEHVLRGEDETLTVARYIIQNPVRARMVAHPTDYAFLGSSTFTVAQILEAIQMERSWSG